MDLVRLCGALCTFSLESNPADVPAYSHLKLHAVFRALDEHIRRHLEIVVPSNTVTLEFALAEPYIHHATVTDERCFRRARWIFGIRSSLPESDLLRLTPHLVKICSAEGVSKLVQRALPGLELLHLSVPPSAISGEADMHYFSISSAGACWQHLLQTKRVGVYVPGDIRDAVFEVTVILENVAQWTPEPATPIARTNSLALSFQDVITVVLRMRYGSQRIPDAAAFRLSIRKMIAASVQEVRALGYSDATSHMALYAIIGFLDESVLNSQDPAFADWARRPLQEEMFGGHFAGETFFKQVADLLNAPESSEVADTLELHAICLLLGYRGKYAFGDSGEIHAILTRIRDKIIRIRGPFALARLAEIPEVKILAKRDKWLTSLYVAAAALILLTVVLFAVYTLSLGSGLGNIHTAALLPPASRISL